MSEELKRLMDNIKRIHDRREEEMRKLSEDPTLEAFATQLMDSFEKDLYHLFNYESAVTGKGDVEPIMGVVETLQDHMRETYRRLVRKDYTPEIVRDSERRKGQ